jgi:hypothetical protein
MVARPPRGGLPRPDISHWALDRKDAAVLVDDYQEERLLVVGNHCERGVSGIGAD